jgi:catechol 2,3-dioxygenase-like lactoylglutathione lyase family enzyme
MIPPAETDLRPPVWIGHVVLSVPNLAAAKAFFLALGMRDAEPNAKVGVLELRGGTHLLLLPGQEPVETGTVAPFDLMVDDLHVTHDWCVEQGFTVTEIRRNPSHEYFLVREPNGHDITVNSSHVTNMPV